MDADIITLEQLKILTLLTKCGKQPLPAIMIALCLPWSVVEKSLIDLEYQKYVDNIEADVWGAI